jgi:hypothetical protein
MEFQGQDDLYVNGGDSLVIESSIGSMYFERPVAYEMNGSGSMSLLGWQPNYSVSDGIMSFTDYGSWDEQESLVIVVGQGTISGASADPGWAAYLGGSGEDFAHDVDTDEDGNLYVVGETHSPNFPVQGQGQFLVYTGEFDAFVGKFGFDYERLWLNYYGGSEDDYGNGLAHDASMGRVYICGETNSGSTSLGTQAGGPNSYVDSYVSSGTGFIAGFEDLFGIRQWATFFGSWDTPCKAIETDNSGNIFVAGETINISSTTSCTPPSGHQFPICNTSPGSYSQSVHEGGNFNYSDGFIARFDANTALKWSTYFGGQGDDYVNDLAVDNHDQRLYMVGSTDELEAGGSYYLFPLQSAGGYFQGTINGNNDPSPTDGFIARFSLNGVRQWCTYFGGQGFESITGVSVRPTPSNGSKTTMHTDVYITGHTTTSFYGQNCAVPTNYGFPQCSTGNSHNQSFGGGYSDAFIARFDENTDLLWSTFLGAGDDDSYVNARVAVNEFDQVFVLGETRSGSHSTSNYPYSSNASYYEQQNHADNGGGQTNTDAFVTGFNGSNQVLYSTYFGGSGTRTGSTLALGESTGGIATYNNRVYISGATFSNSDFPFRCPYPGTSWCQQYGTVSGTARDAFLAQLEYSNVLGTEELHSVPIPQMLAWPNPTNSTVLIAWTSAKPSETRIETFDMLGRKVSEVQTRSAQGANTIELDLDFLPSGAYIVKMESRWESGSVKVLKL